MAKRHTPLHLQDAQHQARAWYKLHKVITPFRILTTGRDLPKANTPTLSMVAISSMLTTAQDRDGWLTIDAPLDPSLLAATMHQVCCEGWSKKRVVIGLAGRHTATTAWVFHDRSVLLTQRHGTHLRVLPIAVWMFSREPGWTPTLLVGAKSDGPHLRIHQPHTKTVEMITPTQGLDVAADETSTPFLSKARVEVDRFDNLFTTITGPHLPPSSSALPAPFTSWPAFLARRHTTPHQEEDQRTLLHHTATWIGQFLHHLNTPTATLTITREREALYVSVAEHILGVCPLARIDATLARALLPPRLAEPIIDLLASPQGFRSVLTAGNNPKTIPWPKPDITITPHTSHHHTLATFAQWGQPPAHAHQAWAQACTP